MPLSPQNIIVVYNSNDSESEAFADYYISQYELDDSGPNSQKVGIPTSSQEILDSYSDFYSSVESPLESAISAIEVAGRTVSTILLGYGFPGGFRDGDHIISSTSRISRIKSPYERKLNNKLFNRQVFQSFNSEDRTFSLVCSRIDAPSLELAKGMVDKSRDLQKQKFINGDFYIDPYSDRNSAGANEYQNAIVDFQNRLLPRLNLDISSTTYIDPYVDVLIPLVTNDSFVWSWFSDRSSLSYFGATNASRAFFYNADYDGGLSLRSIDDRTWPVLAIRAGYIATAGAMSNPTNYGFLFPKPFFETLFRGGSLGEAFLFSQPYLNWTLSVIGDPLLSFSFPNNNDEIDDISIGENESIRLMSEHFGRSVAHAVRRSSKIEDVLNKIVQSNDIATSVDLLQYALNIYNKNKSEQVDAQMSLLSDGFFEYIEKTKRFKDLDNPYPSIDDVLQENDIKFTRLIVQPSKKTNIVSDTNILETGSWKVEIDLEDKSGSFSQYHFDLQVSDDENFDNIIVNIDSRADQTNWTYEINKEEFDPIGTSGVPSSHIGRRIRYSNKAGEELSRSNIYHIRIRHKDQLTDYPYYTFTDIVFS